MKRKEGQGCVRVNGCADFFSCGIKKWELGVVVFFNVKFKEARFEFSFCCASVYNPMSVRLGFFKYYYLVEYLE